jgi:hypothetical protein
MIPGPWRYEKRFATGVVVNAEGEVVAQDVGPADGPVLAAASELVEALRDMVARFDTGAGSDTIGPGLSEAEAATCRRARAALKKVESRP